MITNVRVFYGWNIVMLETGTFLLRFYVLEHC